MSVSSILKFLLEIALIKMPRSSSGRLFVNIFLLRIVFKAALSLSVFSYTGGTQLSSITFYGLQNTYSEKSVRAKFLLLFVLKYFAFKRALLLSCVLALIASRCWEKLRIGSKDLSAWDFSLPSPMEDVLGLDKISSRFF